MRPRARLHTGLGCEVHVDDRPEHPAAGTHERVAGRWRGSMPTRFNAADTRPATSTGRCPLSIARARAPTSATTSSSPSAIDPPASVPVTTVPAAGRERTVDPQTAGARSTEAARSRYRVERGAQVVEAASAQGVAHDDGGVVPLGHGETLGQLELRELEGVGVHEVALRERATPCVIPRSSRMRRCSSLWGIHPSSAPTTNSATSTAPTPASMFLRKRTCPGTSTKAISAPLGNVVKAKPRSMVSPRFPRRTGRGRYR